MKGWRVKTKVCRCGGKVERGRFRCRKCHREDQAAWVERVPEGAARRERRRVMAYWRMCGLLPRGKCACGRDGRAKLLDLYDPSTVWHQCPSCEREMWWCRKRGVEFKVKDRRKEMEWRRVSSERARANLGKLREGFERYRERLKK